jgi:hypothetical protein
MRCLFDIELPSSGASSRCGIRTDATGPTATSVQHNFRVWRSYTFRLFKKPTSDCTETSQFSRLLLLSLNSCTCRLPIRATCLPISLFLIFITLVISVEQYKLWSSSLCCFLQSPVTSFFLGQNISFGILFSNTLSPCDGPSFTPIQNNSQNYRPVCFNLNMFRQQMERQKS